MIAKRMIVQFTFVFFALYGLDRSPAFCDQGQAKYTQTQDQTVKGKTVKDKVTKQFLESQEKKLVDFVRPILSFFTKKQLLTSEELNERLSKISSSINIKTKQMTSYIQVLRTYMYK